MGFLRKLIFLAALAAGAAYVKQLLDEQQDRQPGPPVPASSTSNGAPSNGTKDATKAELYEEAQKLGIEGRSKMTKSQLERAIRDAG